MPMMYGHGGWLLGGGMWLFWIALVVLLIFGIRWATATSHWRGEVPGTARAMMGSSAEEIVKQRYARGEISKQEYEQLLADLRR